MSLPETDNLEGLQPISIINDSLSQEGSERQGSLTRESGEGQQREASVEALSVEGETYLGEAKTPWYEGKIEGPGALRSVGRGLDSEFGRGVVRRAVHTFNGTNKVGGMLRSANAATWSATKALSGLVKHMWTFNLQSDKNKGEEGTPLDFDTYCKTNKIQGAKKTTLKVLVLTSKYILGSAITSVLAGAAAAVTAATSAALVAVRAALATVWALRTPIAITLIALTIAGVGPFAAVHTAIAALLATIGGGFSTAGTGIGTFCAAHPFKVAISTIFGIGFIAVAVALARLNHKMNKQEAARAEEKAEAARKELMENPENLQKAARDLMRHFDMRIIEGEEEGEGLSLYQPVKVEEGEESTSPFQAALNAALEKRNEAEFIAAVVAAEGRITTLEEYVAHIQGQLPVLDADAQDDSSLTHSDSAYKQKEFTHVLREIQEQLNYTKATVAQHREFIENQENGLKAHIAELKAGDAAEKAEEASAAKQQAAREKEATLYTRFPQRRFFRRLFKRHQPATLRSRELQTSSPYYNEEEVILLGDTRDFEEEQDSTRQETDTWDWT